MNKKYKKIFIAVSLIILSVTFIPVFAIEKLEYEFLEPGVFGDQITKTTSLSTYVGQMFNLLIAIAVALAVIMIIIGGFEYMTTDSWGGKDEGKKKIKDAFVGLGLALISYLILYTINPCLVQFTGGEKCDEKNQILTNF